VERLQFPHYTTSSIVIADCQNCASRVRPDIRARLNIAQAV
jgi:hypothetical protein